MNALMLTLSIDDDEIIEQGGMKLIKIIREEWDTIILTVLGAIIMIYRGYAVSDYLNAVKYEEVKAAQGVMNQLQIYINCYIIVYLLYESIWCKKVYTQACAWRSFFIKHIKIILCQFILCVIIALCLNQVSAAFDVLYLQIGIFILNTMIAYAVYKYYEIAGIIKGE